MTLTVYTSRIDYSGPDRIDITRKSGCRVGKCFAPSWKILKPALDDMKRAGKMRADASLLPSPRVRAVVVSGANDLHDAAWRRYVDAFTSEMRVSYRENRGTWDDVLSRDEVTLCCYCTDAAHCHRRLVADMLVKLGATYGGER